MIIFRAFLFPEDQQIKLGFQAVTGNTNVTALKVRCVFILIATIDIIQHNLKQQTYFYFTLTGPGQPSFHHFSPFWNFTSRPAGGSTAPLQVCHTDRKYFTLGTFCTLRPIVNKYQGKQVISAKPSAKYLCAVFHRHDFVGTDQLPVVFQLSHGREFLVRGESVFFFFRLNSHTTYCLYTVCDMLVTFMCLCRFCMSS